MRGALRGMLVMGVGGIWDPERHAGDVRGVITRPSVFIRSRYL